MASHNLKIQLIQNVASMFDQGLLEQQFQQVEVLKPHNIGFMIKFITTFFNAIEKLLPQVDSILDTDTVDFSKLLHTLYKLKSSSVMMGSKNMRLAMLPLVQSCNAMDRNGCINALQGFKCEYQRVRSKLETIVQLEQIIIHGEQN